jgi:hypothetical protein
MNSTQPRLPELQEPEIIAMESEQKLRPRLFNRPQLCSEPGECYDDNIFPLSLSGLQDDRQDYRNTRMMDNTAMLEANRRSLRRFESLDINGKKLTSMSIGGFEVDYNVVATKAMEVLPLPASKLPVIFVDDNLNFYHHFFEGMKFCVGATLLEDIVSRPEYYDALKPIVIPVIEELVETGHEKTDTELTLFLKKIFTTTFDLLTKSRRNASNEEVVVTANIWGFQYIETGMKCTEADLKVWLSICYNHYRTLWFNTFKSTGVPSFARTTRSRSTMSNESSSSSDSVKSQGVQNIHNQGHVNDPIYEDDDTRTIRTSNSRRRKRTHRSDTISRFMRS